MWCDFLRLFSNTVLGLAVWLCLMLEMSEARLRLSLLVSVVQDNVADGCEHNGFSRSAAIK